MHPSPPPPVGGPPRPGPGAPTRGPFRSGREPPAAAEPPDRIGFLRTLTVEPGEVLRDAVCILCPVVVRGTVERDAVGVWGGVVVDGRVGADAVAVGGALRVSGRVGGDPVAVGGTVLASEHAVLADEAFAAPWIHFAGQRDVVALGAIVFVLAHVLLALAGSLLLGERRVAHVTAIWVWSPRRTLLLGLPVFVVVIGLTALGVLAGGGVVTVAGLLGSLVLLTALVVGLPPLGLVLGRRLRPALGWRGACILGALVIALASLVPLLGLVISLVVWCAACGLAARGLAFFWTASGSPPSGSHRDVLRFYALGLEKGRLDQGYFTLERERTRELILRHLPPPPGVVLDVGGAAGAHAFWLAERGYEVHLLDPSPLHVDQAQSESKSRDTGRLASIRVGDARELPFDDDSAAAVLLLGPLYHLTELDERRKALDEARRVLRPGGWLLAAAISRFASLFDGLRGPLFEDPAFARIVERDLADGQHRNDTDNPLYFTTAFFHHPGELSAEVREAGFELAGLFAVEGPGALVPDFGARWKDPRSQQRLLDLLRSIEREPAVLGASPHLLAVAQKP